MPRWLLSLALPVLAVGGIVAAEVVQRSSAPASTGLMAATLPAAGFGSASQEDASAATDRQIALAREMVERNPTSWLSRQVLSRALSQSYGAAGDFDALVEAGQQLAAGRDAAPRGSGPNLTSAEWAMSVHDLDLARTSLAAFDAQVVKLSRGERAAAISLRGDIAFYTGDMASAATSYDEAARIEPGPGTIARKAILAKAQGDFDTAIGHLTEAGRADALRTPRTLADLALQIGAIEMARGRYRKASEWYGRAEKLLPGYWKTQLYAGQAALIAGRTGEAVALWENAVEQSGAPEAMDALAMAYRREGDRAKSLAWSGRAKAEWQRRLALSPFATMAHAAEHELAFGDATEALDMARRNAAARPYGEARILLAKALNANGRFADARRELLAAQKGGWRSALLYVELARSEDALGDMSAAADARARALELNPKISTPQAAMIWFAHG
ncbi:hypothetical protein Q9K02_04580 [Qipengyuania sp. G39]|uniref:Tetratricopeptide repeat protein n=1 Tax=Qipengyuania profundimaris TaxID=3067652 RepID=A0ABT9HNW3_9SPHN|nr:hypothetical protein [Qipengyuania sp. G39]MDP4574413.1 hypothetical protein [Qipengyuania sp. G39]